MDLDDFEQVQDVDDAQAGDLQIQDWQEALRHFDESWYSAANRRGLIMDLIGDYGGSELFIIHGDSLLQSVLDDKLLGIGDDRDPSFQIVHAIYILERTLHEYRRRSANFHVVFWEDSRHATIRTGCSRFSLTSRSLARSILYQHLKTLQIAIFTFESTNDPAWGSYLRVHRPMYILLNDGGSGENAETNLQGGIILQQRILVFDMITQGVSVSLLASAEFRDSKILSLVIEQRLDLEARQHLSPKFWGLAKISLQYLDSKYLDISGSMCRTPLVRYTKPSQSNFLETVVCDTITSFLKLKSPNVARKYELLYLFIAHLLILPNISLEDRARQSPCLDKALTKDLQTRFLPLVFTALEEVQTYNYPIDIDGHIFLDLVAFFLENPSMPCSQAVGKMATAQLTSIWKRCKLPSVDLSTLVTSYSHLPSAYPKTVDDHRTLGVLPFQNDLFDELLSDVHVDVDDRVKLNQSAQLNFSQTFTESQHWHNHRRPILPKHLGGKDPTPTASQEWLRRRLLRREQNFVSQLERQAQTLTGALGKTLQRIVITSSSGPVRSMNERNYQANLSRKSPAKESAAERIRRENAEKKLAKENASNEEWWSGALEVMSTKSLPQRIEHLQALLQNWKRAGGRGWLAVEMRLYELNLEILSWLEHPNRDSLCDSYSVSVLRKVKEIIERGGLFCHAAKALAAVLVALGSVESPDALVDSSPHAVLEDKRKLHFDFVKLLKSRSQAPKYKFMRITEDPMVWQLRLFGPYMDRSMDSQPDPRVHFEPDAWQRKVLDCLDDDGHSVLVVAPTSAGKTFISYYAMEKVLRSGDDDLLVYVAPTKALVSQIAAEVYARFSKSYKTSRSCWAIHTRDYRIHDPQNCQILVTVPEILASFLISPALAKNWVPRIKRIILDEIHSIGQQEGGAVWEQILLLAPCPIIGLSATVGNPEQFNVWLESVQNSHGYRHTFINHPHRYSHLRKFTYLLPRKPVSLKALEQGLPSYTATENLRFLHPAFLLSFGVRDIPPDFSLEPADCLTLYQALKALKICDGNELSRLDPATYFDRSRLLRQQDVIQYESELKCILSKIISISDPQDVSSPLQQIVRRLQDPLVSKFSPAEQNEIPSKETFLNNLLPFVADLHVQGDLPAILFNFDRTACEVMAQALLDGLERLENKWRKCPEWKEKLSRWETWKAGEKDRKRQAEKLSKQARGKSDEIIEHYTSWEEIFDPSDPLSQFSFATPTGSYTIEDLKDDLARLSWANIPAWAKDCLRRGIAVHHAGMNKQYRTLVESLFRLGFVRVVIATGTLALGINAPAKTSVFCGDSPYLTALQYRQCAGRAGRRGYDLLGKVVFYGIAMDRAQRLVLSKLPALGGNFPLTSTMVLRLFNLLHGSNNARTAVDAVRRLMSLPQISFLFDTGRHQLLHHVRFSIDYLRRAGLLDSSGKPIDLCGIAAHLYYTEPSNLALVALFQGGVIHQICSQSSRIDAKRDFVLLMAHLFNRQKMPKVYTSASNVKERIKKSASVVILPPLPDHAKSLLMKHNAEILDIFVSYAKAFATRYRDELGQDNILPFSLKKYPVHSFSNSSERFLLKLHASALSVKARSMFVANSGHSDDFGSISELSQTARTGLHLNDHAIPTMESFTQSSDDFSFTLNAYLLDFYTHGQKAPLVIANGIRQNDLWYLLQDFTLVLKATRSSLEELLLGVAKDVQEGDGDTSEAESTTAVDPAEVDEDGKFISEGSGGDSVTAVEGLSRPVGISDGNWNVFTVIDEVTTEFEEKFKGMWA